MADGGARRISSIKFMLEKKGDFLVKVKSECKVRPRTGHEGPQCESRYSSNISLISALDVGWLLAPAPGRFIPETDPLPIV